MMKKINRAVRTVCIALAACLLMPLSTSALRVGDGSSLVSPMWTYTYVTQAYLSVSSSGLASVSAALQGTSSVTKINAYVYLRKMGSPNVILKSETWTVNSSSISDSFTYQIPSSYQGSTFNVYVSFTVFAGSNYEIVSTTSNYVNW